VRSLVERVVGHRVRSDAGRQAGIAGRLRGSGQGVPGPAEQPAQFLPGRLGPGSVRFLGQRGARRQQLDCAPGRCAGERGCHGKLSFRVARQPGRLVQVDYDARTASQLVALAAATDRIRSEHPAQPAHQRGHVLRRLLGRVAGPQHLGDPVYRHQPGPLDGEQLQQRARLTAAQLAVRQRHTVAGHAKNAGEAQLQLRTTAGSTGRDPPHAPFVLAAVGPSKRQPDSSLAGKERYRLGRRGVNAGDRRASGPLLTQMLAAQALGCRI
jgi:hypothetical protein